jgi:uncharacterized protein YecE (DUF72 family)
MMTDEKKDLGIELYADGEPPRDITAIIDRVATAIGVEDTRNVCSALSLMLSKILIQTSPSYELSMKNLEYFRHAYELNARDFFFSESKGKGVN